MFNDVHIQGFRGISDLKFDDFKQFNLFVGKNNCCKTSVLESLYVLVNPTNPGLPSKTNLFRGINVVSENSLELLFHNFEIEEPIKIKANMDKIHKIRSLKIKPKLDSGVSLDYQNNSFEEKLIDERYFQSGTIPGFNGLIFETSFLDFKNKEKKYKAEIYIEITDKGRSIQQTKPKEYIEKFKGVFLSPEYFAHTQTVKQFGDIVIKKRKENIVKVLKQIEPLLTDLTIGPENIIFCDLGLYKMLPINVMGSGIYKILSIILAIEDNQDGVVFIDEVENGLFYTSQEILWKAVFASAKEFNVQIFATTHSIECTRALSLVSSEKLKNLEDDIRVYRIERQKEDFRVVKFNKENIELTIEKDWDIR